MTQTKKSWLQEREGKTYLLEQLCCRCENPLRDNDYDKHHELNGRYLCADCRSQILNNQSNMIKEKSKTFKFGLSQDVRAQKEEVQRHVKEEVQHHGYSCQACGKAGLYRLIYGGHGSVFCGFCANKLA